MFNKGFNNVKKLKRFKELKKLNKVYYTAISLVSLNKFLAPNIFSFKTFIWFKQDFPNKIIKSFNGNFQGF